MYRYTVRRANSLTLKPSTASAAKYAAIPASTTAIKRSKRQGMVPNDHSGMICNIPKSTPDIILRKGRDGPRRLLHAGYGVHGGGRLVYVQKVTILKDGKAETAYVCARCLKSDKVERA